MIGALGRLDPNKRIDLTMEAAAPMLGEACKILVIGRGEDQDRLTAAAARLGVTDNVIFGGYQSDTRAMLSAFDLYVASSVQETFGLSVLEALASGLPVLYTTCPALDGIQTERARMVAGTAAALRDEIRKEFETGPRPRVADSKVFARYGIESVVSRIDDLYEQVLAARPRRVRRAAARRHSQAPRAGGNAGPRRCPAGAVVMHSRRWRSAVAVLAACAMAAGLATGLGAIPQATAATAPRVDLNVLVVSDGTPWPRPSASNWSPRACRPRWSTWPTHPGRRSRGSFLPGPARRHAGRQLRRASCCPVRRAVRACPGPSKPRWPGMRRAFGVRQVDAYSPPRPGIGMNAPGYGGLARAAR